MADTIKKRSIRRIAKIVLLFAILVAGEGCEPPPGPFFADLPYIRPSSDWFAQTYLKASNTGANDWFSRSVALSDDGDTLAVGAQKEDSNATGVNSTQTDNSATDSGAVYVFTRTAGTWNQQTYLKASNTDAGDDFGIPVALSGDTLVVGAALEDSNATGVNSTQTDNSATDSGAVYVFTRSGATWSQQAYLKASNTGTGDWFGYSVALSGDTLAVGALQEDSNATGVSTTAPTTAGSGATESGAVYVFTRSGATWSQSAYLKASNTGAGDWFGHSVALSGDGDTLAVGALREDSNVTGVSTTAPTTAGSGATESGAVYVFTRDGGTWSQSAYLKASNTGAGDWFSHTVALSGDGDTLVVGAIKEDSNATGVSTTAPTTAGSGATESGAVYVFTRSGATWSQSAYLKASNTGAGDWFSRSIALSGNRLAVGVSLEDSNATGVSTTAPTTAGSGASDSGAVYVVQRTAR